MGDVCVGDVCVGDVCVGDVCMCACQVLSQLTHACRNFEHHDTLGNGYDQNTYKAILLDTLAL